MDLTRRQFLAAGAAALAAQGIAGLERVTGATSQPVGGVVHIIGNAHLDPAWMWRWHEGFAESNNLSRTAIELMAEFPDYTFARSSAQSYEWILQNDPELFDRIKAAVARGQWDIVGGWWEQPDDNIPSAESFNRQALYGQRFFLNHFGRAARLGYCVDSFGHCGGLPALLKAAGMDAFVFTRPGGRGPQAMPNLFEWVSPDGSSVLGIHSPTNSYGTWTEDMAAGLSTAMQNIQADVGHVHFPYGWGDHGGGPTRANIVQLQAIIAGEYDEAVKLGAGKEAVQTIRGLLEEGKITKLTLSTFTRLTEAVLPLMLAGRLPRIAKELQYVAQGAYTSCSNIKYGLRQLENELFRAESALVAAQRLGVLKDGLKSDLDEAWKAVLFNQFHDLGAGTAFPPAVDDTMLQLGHGRHLADRVANRACQAIFRRLDATKMDFCHFVFNPLPWPVKRVIPLRWAPTAYDGAGRPMAFQPVLADAYRSNNDPAVTVATLPACGGRLFYNGRDFHASPEPAEAPVICAGPLHEECIQLHQGSPTRPADPTATGPATRPTTVPAASRPAATNPLRAGEAPTARMDNGLLSVEFDGQGNLASLRLKQTGVELLAGPVAPLVIDDPADAWGGGWRQPMKFDNVIAPMKCPAARIVDDGPILGTVRCEYACDDGQVWIDYSLASGLAYVDARVEIQWHGRHRMIKLAVPTAIAEETLTFDTPLAPTVRPTDGVEGPGQKWIDLTGSIAGRPYGLSVMNDAKYGSSCAGSELRLTLLRSAHMCSGGGRIPRRTPWHYMDQNLQRFWLRFYPHAGDWRAAGVPRVALELNCPPFILHGGRHPGDLSPDFSAVTLEPANVLPLAIKPPEDGGGTVVRLWESTGQPTEAKLTLQGKSAAVGLKAFQMKTLLVDGSGLGLKVVELDTIERPV